MPVANPDGANAEARVCVDFIHKVLERVRCVVGVRSAKLQDHMPHVTAQLVKETAIPLGSLVGHFFWWIIDRESVHV